MDAAQLGRKAGLDECVQGCLVGELLLTVEWSGLVIVGVVLCRWVWFDECTLHSIQYTLYPIQYSVYCVQCTLYTVHHINCTTYTLHDIQCALYTTRYYYVILFIELKLIATQFTLRTDEYLMISFNQRTFDQRYY